MLVTSADILRHAQKNGYAVAAYGTHGGDFGLMEVVLRVAGELRSPVILLFEYDILAALHDMEVVAAAAVRAAQKVRVPVALQLDGVIDPEAVEPALNAGFNSVMLDASCLQAAEICKRAGATIEAKLGIHTGPGAARRFVESTGVDVLGIDVADVERLEDVHEQVDLPLALYGTEGLRLEQIKEYIGKGVRKVNITGVVTRKFFQAILEYADAHKDDSSEKPLKAGRAPVEKLMRQHLAAFGSENRY